jgi:two-component system response regulator MprA
VTARGRILVVEDDESLRETLAEVLADDGHDVRVAADGEAALDALHVWTPDLILLDLMMPRMDGFAFREAQRGVEEARPAKILLLSAAHAVESAADELQADAWLVKPFGVADVLRAVDELLAAPD